MGWGRVGSTAAMIGCGDVADWAEGGRRANGFGHFALGSGDSLDKGEANGLERVRFVRFGAEKNAP